MVGLVVDCCDEPTVASLASLMIRPASQGVQHCDVHLVRRLSLCLQVRAGLSRSFGAKGRGGVCCLELRSAHLRVLRDLSRVGSFSPVSRSRGHRPTPKWDTARFLPARSEIETVAALSPESSCTAKGRHGHALLPRQLRTGGFLGAGLEGYPSIAGSRRIAGIGALLTVATWREPFCPKPCTLTSWLQRHEALL